MEIVIKLNYFNQAWVCIELYVRKLVNPKSRPNPLGGKGNQYSVTSLSRIQCRSAVLRAPKSPLFWCGGIQSRAV